MIFEKFQVPGRMGMLVTLYLMLINSHNSIEAPSGRGFSNIEVWFIGIQAPIAFGIIEYGAILALKRFSRFSDQKINLFGDLSFEPVNLMDVASFIISGLSLSAFKATKVKINLPVFLMLLSSRVKKGWEFF